MNGKLVGEGVRFERMPDHRLSARRSVDRFNDAKAAESGDRVTHINMKGVRSRVRHRKPR